MARWARFAAVLAAASITACGSTDEVKCQPGYALCDNVCVAVSNDPANCGGCGIACGAGEACAAAACVATCQSSLRAPVQDRWGTWWDGLERPPASLSAATAACEGIGGRLPIATEAYRVSWARKADVGQSYQTNPLWTLVPYNATEQFAFRMSDGASSVPGVGTTQAYRCICPADAPQAFADLACNGAPGAECHTLGGGNAGYNLDAEDRAPLSKGGAMWECGFSGAALPTFLQYAEAILGGAPDGSTAWLHVADDTRYDLDALVRWTGVETDWLASDSTTTSTMTDRRPFRCIGRSAAPAPTAPAGAFVGVGGKAADAADRAAEVWVGAHTTCFNASGHLAASTELGTLVQQGLPGGANAWLWTSDQEGWNTVQFLAGLLRWNNGEDTRFGHYHDTYVTWGYKTTGAPGYAFRCLYYPVDATRAAPAGCNGGCTEILVGGTGGLGARMWFDTQDRSAAVFTAALSICANQGGHLASERDLTEAIRAGLPNGSGTRLHTSDLVYGSAGPLRTTIVSWTGIDGNYTDQYSTYMTWSDGLADTRPYRCVWTNELR